MTQTPPASEFVHSWMPEAVYLQQDENRYESISQTFDLMTEDGKVVSVERPRHNEVRVVVAIDDIPKQFQGLRSKSAVPRFVLKSTLSQLGIDVHGEPEVNLDAAVRRATVSVTLTATAPLGILTLDVIDEGAYIGKLVAFPDNRRIRTPEYVNRLAEVKDANNKPVFIVGSEADAPEVEQVDGRVILWLPLLRGVVTYTADMSSLLPTVGKALASATNVKHMLRLHQAVDPKRTAICSPSTFMMVRSKPFCTKTMFARVVDSLLPAGLRCASSNVIEPTSELTRDDRTFVFVGTCDEPLARIPLELFSVESFREHVPFALRKSLPERSEDAQTIIKAFHSCPADGRPACLFVTKGGMLAKLQEGDWVLSDPKKLEGHERLDAAGRLLQAKGYLHQQAEYPVLTAISVGDITSDGILLTKYFPSPILKSQMLSRDVVGRLKAIMFTQVSRSYGNFFSQEDRAMLIDLCNFGIRVYHVDVASNSMNEFIRRGDSGLFVPLERRVEAVNATYFGVYGSNLVEGDFEGELRKLLEGVLEIRKTSTHPLLNPQKPVALVTGGGPGAMEVGNRVAKQLGILSCGMFVDFGSLARKPGSNINEQKKNPYVEAYMTYRPEKLVERQSEFGLDFPIFLTGGVGTDFEYALEEVRRKVGTIAINPMILFGADEHFTNKIGRRFEENSRCGVIRGSEWLSNVPYVVKAGSEALEVYRRFFNNTLPIGGKAPANKKGFVLVDEQWLKNVPTAKVEADL